jgi:Predicted dehydrogenases and related proteins
MNSHKILNVGVISCSGMAKNHMLAVKSNNSAWLAAVCDIDEVKAKAAAQEYNVNKVYVNYHDLLDQPEIDAVIICTPDQLHREMVLASLKAGKHVLCEKPMALTIEDCQDIVEAGRNSDRKLMVGQICRYTPGFKLAKELIDKGEIGELFYVESEYAHDYSKIIGPGHWRNDPLRHAFLGGGCHAVDLLRWIAGNPYEITAYSNKKVLKGLPTDDCTIAIMRFPNDVIGKVFVSIGCKRDYTMRSVFYGNRGTIIADNTTPHLTIFKDDVAKGDSLFDNIERHATPILYPVSLSSHNTIDEFNEFCDIILNNKEVRTTALEGASTVAACLAAVESAKIAKAVSPEYFRY